MKGMCQTCGTVAPLEWFLNEPVSRQAMTVLAELPKEIQEHVFHYLALFRPASGRSLTPKKALRLLTELRELAAKGYVSRKGRPDRPCSASLWGAAMETMATQRHSLNLPMPNHKYLVKVAWDLADQADAANERQRNEAERSGNSRPSDDVEKEEQLDFSQLTKAEIERLPNKIRKKYGV